MLGVDISYWNGKNDFERAKKCGIEFVILRASYGYNNSDFKNGGLDSTFYENYNKVLGANLLVGVYHYSYARTESEALLEAKKILQTLEGRNLDLPIFYDVEDLYMQSYEKNVTNRINIFTSEILNNGYKAGVYANLNWYRNYINENELYKDIDKWIARYNEKLYSENPMYYSNAYQIWQFKSTTTNIDGITNLGGGIKTVDLNIAYKKYNANNGFENARNNNFKNFKLIKENGTFVLTVPSINIRELPNTKAKIIAKYTKGDRVKYDYFTICNGYVWISYIAKSGNRRYMAIGEHDGNKRISLWGYFI